MRDEWTIGQRERCAEKALEQETGSGLDQGPERGSK